MHDEKRKIVFCASTPMNYIMFRPISLALEVDPRLELWFTAKHGARRLYSTVGLNGERLISAFRAQWTKFDMCICPGTFFEPKRTRVKVQVFHTAGLTYTSCNPRYLTFDKLFLVGPYLHDKFISTGILKADDSRLEPIGMPKVDCLVDGSLNAAQIKESLGIQNDLPTVCYAPTRSSIHKSSLELMGEDLIATIAGMKVNFLIKLHDRNFMEWRRKTRVNWREIIAKYENDRVKLVNGYDSSPYLYVSDVLVSDTSSTANEFLLLDRPLVFVDVPEYLDFIDARERKWGNPVSDLRAWGRNTGRIVATPAELRQAIQEAIDNPEERGEIRREYAKRFFYGPGSATARAVKRIYELLELEPLPVKT